MTSPLLLDITALLVGAGVGFMSIALIQWWCDRRQRAALRSQLESPDPASTTHISA